jgi:hypothetical protein
MSKYQVIEIGSDSSFRDNLFKVLDKHLLDLGVQKDSLVVLNRKNFHSDYKGNSPAFCLYFGDENGDFKDLAILEALISEATLILPISKDLTQFGKHFPKMLGNINGAELGADTDIEKIVSSILEGLCLLRLSRRLFISYKRDESTQVAIQLFEALERTGFDVFLDTHSIRPGEPFQDELWHRMADTDVMVLLNTPGFLKSNWTTQELAKANSMSIGILQLIWPTHKLERDAELSIPLFLEASSFGNARYQEAGSYLTDTAVQQIVSEVESLRARSLASRQDNIITEFISSSIKLGVKADLQAEKFISVVSKDGKEKIVIPTVGVPQAFTYNQSEELVARIKSKKVREAFLLYDHRNIREKWLTHLSWLDNYLPIKTVKIVEAEAWLKKI